MRRLNIFLIAGMLATFLAHAIAGSLRLAGADADVSKPIAWVCIGFVCAHLLVSLALTAETLHARHLSGAGYFKNNMLFWVRRISGFTIPIPLVMHLVIFGAANAGAYRLRVFTAGRMISQILLVAAIALHVLANIRPALISCGIKGLKAYAVDILLILSILLLLFTAAFVIYYVRWAAC